MRVLKRLKMRAYLLVFPFLFGGTFIEGPPDLPLSMKPIEFPFLFGGTFIEAFGSVHRLRIVPGISLPFLEGLSLRRIALNLLTELINCGFPWGFH